MTTTQNERKDTTETDDELTQTLEELEAEVMAAIYEEYGEPDDDENEE